MSDRVASKVSKQGHLSDTQLAHVESRVNYLFDTRLACGDLHG